MCHRDTDLFLSLWCGLRKAHENEIRAQELCESRGGRPGLPNKPTVSVDVKQHFNQPIMKMTGPRTSGRENGLLQFEWSWTAGPEGIPARPVPAVRDTGLWAAIGEVLLNVTRCQWTY